MKQRGLMMYTQELMARRKIADDGNCGD